jgi:hypothetical protein
MNNRRVLERPNADKSMQALIEFRLQGVMRGDEQEQRRVDIDAKLQMLRIAGELHGCHATRFNDAI